MSECLHCEINQLVQQRIERGDADLTELASMMVESLAELVLLAPQGDQAKLMADVIAHFGHTFLETSGALEGQAPGARH